jgi:hypothetical protein
MAPSDPVPAVAGAGGACPEPVDARFRDALPRLVRRALLLLGAVVVAWLITALLGSRSAHAEGLPAHAIAAAPLASAPVTAVPPVASPACPPAPGSCIGVLLHDGLASTAATLQQVLQGVDDAVTTPSPGEPPIVGAVVRPVLAATVQPVLAAVVQPAVAGLVQPVSGAVASEAPRVPPSVARTDPGLPRGADADPASLPCSSRGTGVGGDGLGAGAGKIETVADAPGRVPLPAPTAPTVPVPFPAPAPAGQTAGPSAGQFDAVAGSASGARPEPAGTLLIVEALPARQSLPDDPGFSPD